MRFLFSRPCGAELVLPAALMFSVTLSPTCCRRHTSGSIRFDLLCSQPFILQSSLTPFPLIHPSLCISVISCSPFIFIPVIPCFHFQFAPQTNLFFFLVFTSLIHILTPSPPLCDTSCIIKGDRCSS